MHSPIAKPRSGAVKSNEQAHINPLDVQFDAQASSQSSTLLIRVTGIRSGDRQKIQTKIRQGLSYKAFSILEKALALPQKDLAQALQIPISTLRRRKEANLFHSDESDRLVRYARIKDAALDLMQGDDAAAIEWLHSPIDLFANETPLTHANTEMGAKDVEDLILRLRHGVFS